MSVNLHLVRLSSPVKLFTSFRSQLRFFWLIIFSSFLALSLPLLSCQTYLAIVMTIQLLPFFTSRHRTLPLLEKTPIVYRWDAAHCSISDFKDASSTTQYSCFICVCDILFHNSNLKLSPFKNIWPYHPAFPQQLAFH